MYNRIIDMITNIKKHIVKGLLCCGFAAMLYGCNDFLTIYPTDRIVGSEFWKKKADVDQMVDGCYQSMLSYDIQERAIMWGAFRSDELVKLADYNDNTSTTSAPSTCCPQTATTGGAPSTRSSTTATSCSTTPRM